MLTEIKEDLASDTLFDTGWLTASKSASVDTYFLENYAIAGGTEPTIVLVDFSFAHASSFPRQYFYCRIRQNPTSLASYVSDRAFFGFNQWALQRGTTNYPYQDAISSSTALASGIVWRLGMGDNNQTFNHVLPNGERAFSLAPSLSATLDLYIDSAAFNSDYFCRVRGYTYSKAQEIFK